MDLKVIADAIALRFVGITSTSDEALASAPTASLPNAVSTGPVLLVYPPEGVTSQSMGRILDTYDYPVKLLRDPLSVPERTDALYAWANAMRPMLYTKFTLGIAGVTEAAVIAMRLAIDGEEYGEVDGQGKKFDVVELTVRVQVFELATGVAP